jgi:large subunit ribosomal protein L33
MKKELTSFIPYVIVFKRDNYLALFFMLKIQVEVADMRTKITLACTECKQRNYNTTKDKKTHPERMEIKKYCRFCKTHTQHKETK